MGARKPDCLIRITKFSRKTIELKKTVKLEDAKGIIKSHHSNKQYDGQKKNDKKTNKGQQNTTQKTKAMPTLHVHRKGKQFIYIYRRFLIQYHGKPITLLMT